MLRFTSRLAKPKTQKERPWLFALKSGKSLQAGSPSKVAFAFFENWQLRGDIHLKVTFVLLNAILFAQALDRWEERLENIWDGKPYDILDAALADTVQKFPVHIQPFRDMIGGMRIDLIKSRYKTFDELYEYMYR